ncbi:hypothetical protein QFZ94_006660 [Paraburkholderia sp. JPY465]
MSWPSMPRRRFRSSSTCAVKKEMDSASAWSIASLKRMTSSSLDSPGSQSSIHSRSTLARRARYSAAIWLMLKPARALRRACVCAAVSVASIGEGARPTDFWNCASRLCEVRKSFAMAWRICCAWSRNPDDCMFAAAGSSVAANASHCVRIGSSFCEIKSASRMDSPSTGRTGTGKQAAFQVTRAIATAWLT